MLAEEYTGLMTNIMTTQLTMPSRQVCQEKSWKVGLREEAQGEEDQVELPLVAVRSTATISHQHPPPTLHRLGHHRHCAGEHDAAR